MRIVRSLDVSGDEFVSDLVAMFENDWQGLTGGKLEAGDLCEGLSWRSDQAHLLVRSFEPSHLFSVEREERAECTCATYLVESGDHGCTVTYDWESDVHDRQHNRLLRGFSEAVYLGRMAESLLAAEDRIRNGGIPRHVQTTSQERLDVRLLRKAVERRQGRQ